MNVGRRWFIKVLAGAAAAVSLPRGAIRRAWAASSDATLGLRSVTGSDAPVLQDLISYCVASDSSFFGKCGEWSLGWAQDFIRLRPQSIVLTRSGSPVAFLEIPTIESAPAPASSDTSPEDAAKQALRELNRTTFRVRAAGIDADADATDEAVRLFYTLIFEGFKTARAMGYRYAEAYAPWAKHPLLSRKWTDYPGCELIDPVARNMEQGLDLYHLRWHLDDAIAALAEEEKFDVA